MRHLLRPLFVIALSLLVLAPARPSRADDPKPAEAKKTYKVWLRERWKVGDVVTRSARETMSRGVESKRGEDAAQKSPGTERQTSYVVVAKCLEADPEGYATKFLLYLVAWSIESGTEKDSSLAGVEVEVHGVGADRAWRILTPDAKPSRAALAWVEQLYGPQSSGDLTYLNLEPKGEIEVGGSWQGDAHAIAARLAGRGVAVDVEKSTAACTLLGVDGGIARLHVKMTFPTTELRLPNAQSLPWKEGGVLELDLDVTRSLTAGEFDAKIHREQKLLGVAVGDGVTVTWEDLGAQDIEVKSGGKMPDLVTVPTPVEPNGPGVDTAPMGDGK